MSLMQMLQQQLSSQAVQALQNQTGADQQQVQQAIQGALPMILGGLAKNAQSKAGARNLWQALDKDHDGNVLNDVSGFLASGQAQQTGAGILKHVLGGQQPQAEQALAGFSGMNRDNAGQVLAALAPMVMGMIGKMQSQNQIDSSQRLAGLLQNERQQLRQQPASSGLLNMLMDADGDGDVDISDVMQRGGLLSKLFGRRR